MTYLSGISRSTVKPVVFFALLTIIMLQGCASQKAMQPPMNATLAPEAQLTFDYLVYMDYRTRLGQIMSKGIRTPQTINEAARIQKDALVVLDRIIAAEPQVKLYLDKFALYWTSQQIDEARETLKEALEKYPFNRDLTINLANTYLVDNRSADAEAVLIEYLHKKPDDLIMTSHLARIYMEQRKFAQALDILKVIPFKKRTPQILYLHGKASAGLGLTKQAIKSFNKAVEAKPDFIEAWGELAYLHELDKNYSEAEKIYTRMLEFPDVSSHIRVRLLELSLKLNNPEQALKLVLEGPRNNAFLLEAAQVFLNGDFYGQASTILDIFAQQKPVPDAYYFFKASIAYEGEDDPAKALDYLNRIAVDSEHYDRSLQFKAHLLMNMGRDKEALDVIRQGQTKLPEAANFYLLEAALHSSSGKDALAEEALLRGNENSPDNPQILFQLGMNAERKGDLDQTLKYMEQIISKHPDHADALNFVGYLLADKGEQLDRAIVLISQANKLEPDNGYIIDSLAWVNYRSGNFEEAWKLINRAVSLKPKQPELWEHYGDIAAARGNKEEAAKGYNNALKFKSENKDELRKKLEEL
ncbi:tetratricopeptide repeat protein [Maridesulfovibrio hydrothermalis]|uniref:Tetratricopeptide TPR_2 repeat protein n=1 Tax=Maridesulfovibrio hydrothermalis AM13 = DSM 14728 TaxID=1121451 RepID=L0RAD6_9BACT|nr:tetratricopeptide repeat protein [Maridesulfovibrio hydrothermalis]CCO23177.1 Tetratricopeptide TPR_2 repeat protein [Maridesulfovibrio hydrothermalis AM13 = DSM 14728]